MTPQTPIVTLADRLELSVALIARGVSHATAPQAMQYLAAALEASAIVRRPTSFAGALDLLANLRECAAISEEAADERIADIIGLTSTWQLAGEQWRRRQLLVLRDALASWQREPTSAQLTKTADHGDLTAQLRRIRPV